MKQLIFDLIDFRSFANLWYWIALAVTWSSASHWIVGVPFDMVTRARRHGGKAMVDLETLSGVTTARILFIADEAGTVLLGFLCFTLAMLLTLGFWFGVQFCQAVFLILFPISIVWLMGTRVARRIRNAGLTGEDLCRTIARHRFWVQVIGLLSILVTSMWGMLQNFSISPLH